MTCVNDVTAGRCVYMHHSSKFNVCIAYAQSNLISCIVALVYFLCTCVVQRGLICWHVLAS